jgi:acetyl-CoA carboxylase carboxyl transferase subunit alpha
MTSYLDFERPVAELEGKINELRHLTNSADVNIAEEVMRLQSKATKLLKQTYASLTPWQKVQIARHPERPQFLDYVNELIVDFTPLAGDRLFGEDYALIGGLGRFNGRAVMVIGQHKGKDTESRIKHNFGMTKPEGYRKAQRLMKIAERFRLPILSFIDTAGAYPGIDAEERGQAEAIAQSIATCLKVSVPFISVIIGEGGSGGAIAIAASDVVMMLEHSVYSVISPEGCASILWRSATKAPEAAEALRLTAQDLYKLDVIDTIIPEPLGGAHRDPDNIIKAVGNKMETHLKTLINYSNEAIVKRRRDKFIGMGQKGL